MFLRFLILLLSIIQFCPPTEQRNSSIIEPGSSISTTNISNYWSSKSGEFAFGFYPKGDGFAVGIWYAKFRQNRALTVVWTARRDDSPLPIQTTLNFTSEGGLILYNQQAQGLPITDTSLRASSASILDDGNLVLYSNSSIVWQSFDFPTDTLLPWQKLLEGKKLISSISKANHSSGKFQLVMQSDGNLVQYPADFFGPNGPETAYWNSETYKAGKNVSLNLNGNGKLYLVNSSGSIIKDWNDISFSTEHTRFYHLTLDANGLLRLYSREFGNGDWRVEWSPNTSKCDPLGLCGPNEYCSVNVNDNSVFCTCLPGFNKIDQEEEGTSLGCERNLNFPNNCSENNVQEQVNVRWVDNPYYVLQVVDIFACSAECSRDCNCDAAIYKNRSCSKQTLPLRHVRTKTNENQGIALVKVASGNFQTTSMKKKWDRIDKLMLVLGLTFLLAAILVLVISGLLIYKFRVRGYKHVSRDGSSSSNSNELDDDVMVRSYKYSVLEKATNGFEEELGRGASGTVFKGVLPKGESEISIAVKRLEIMVGESEREFLNEVKIIGRTHHRNLVQLLGYCHEGNNRLLVYEYMSNGSLVDFLFNPIQENHKPMWEERIRIALDIARGIMYLHEECKTQIIHCDIKPENILMDENGRAKIADFGVAKLLMPYQTKTRTRMRGTRGYVAPEWYKNVPVTTKADVYSFGIMLLEIVCCRRSLDVNADEDEVVLSEWVYDSFAANEVEKVVAGLAENGVGKAEVERVVKVGLWCIQNEPSLRPLMKKVVLMLEGTVEIPIPPSPVSFLSSI